jgi:phospholipid/cholesterol/gamma-HCH transport system substrate-binding protein
MAQRAIAEIVTGAAVLFIAGGFLVFAAAHSGRSATSGYDLHAQFDHVDGLNSGADVRIAGVKVGSVVAMTIDQKSFLASVTLTVRSDIHLPSDTAAEIVSESLLGGKYVSLSPGGASTDIAPGGTLTITQSSVSLEQLLGKFIFSAASLTDKSKSDSATGAPGAASGQAAPK